MTRQVTTDGEMHNQSMQSIKNFDSIGMKTAEFDMPKTEPTI